jgi:hypothetical protein
LKGFVRLLFRPALKRIFSVEPIKLTKAAKRRKMGVRKYCLRPEGSVRRVDSLRQEEEGGNPIESEKAAGMHMKRGQISRISCVRTLFHPGEPIKLRDRNPLYSDVIFQLMIDGIVGLPE